MNGGTERYTPGHDTSAVGFMAARTAATHARFFLPHLAPGTTLLDLGCGPGTITADLAAAVAPGRVLGLDRQAAQLSGARALARLRGLTNIEFREGSCYDIPLEDRSVDRVFSHALMEHLARPDRALAEIRRVLRPGGTVGLCSPDWGGFLLAPPADDAVGAYTRLQRANGGDPFVGRELGRYLTEAGFGQCRLDAHYERYDDPSRIAGYLAVQLDDAGQTAHARRLRDWAAGPAAMFAQAWVTATATRPR
ncbi:methyltransferase domain-containing protein [Actinomadura sp. NEAU-AAG7]|uniref:methyltransferase domain-containing protein n=1 Tax=Actinomadura sp. NEAU-AAG7 TaxID=2839640 RepID=UPI001BE452AA|nr:methyltransferase domain-containing protein [Actinomadura sp. NEAU-AAG7]MBT2212273.1 methyltransferase domain-containing protein [Actinomadura sp. NEAU-AAG7]